MANQIAKDLLFAIDVGSTVTNISGHINSASISAALSMIEDSTLSDSDRTYLPGLHGKTMSVSGVWNSTTEGIFGGAIQQRTSVTKTVELGTTLKYYNGESYINNVQLSGSLDDLITFSADLQITGAMNRTSVKLSS